MTKFAAYYNHSIYAVADSAEKAVADARLEVRDQNALFNTAQISEELAAWIEENGWNGNYRSFDVIDGEIIDTTDK